MDMSSIVFFVGILLAVATLEHTHVLTMLAGWLDRVVGRQELIVIALGLLSAIVDNGPLVAATMGMYRLAQYPTDSFLWEFIAYCAGTGGSILIIGSAAGVAAMGLEKIEFFWYVKRISGLAMLGYLGGAATYIFAVPDVPLMAEAIFAGAVLAITFRWIGRAVKSRIASCFTPAEVRYRALNKNWHLAYQVSKRANEAVWLAPAHWRWPFIGDGLLYAGDADRLVVKGGSSWPPMGLSVFSGHETQYGLGWLR